MAKFPNTKRCPWFESDQVFSRHHASCDLQSNVNAKSLREPNFLVLITERGPALGESDEMSKMLTTG